MVVRADELSSPVAPTTSLAAKACFACGAPLDPALAGLAEGALFASRFEILGPLGRGGMGMVYRAFDRELGETVAIKVLRPDVARESGRVEQRFRSEIRLARRVRHRNVCSVYGDGEDRGLLYICMELVEGENLARAAREGSGLPPAEAWSAALQVADGLRAIHEVGVVHRDLKTANLMRDRDGVVRVMDFGIAKQHGRGRADGATVTATGALMGTPEYMSPEQLRGEEVDFRSDLYSLGHRRVRALHRGAALPRRHAGRHHRQAAAGCALTWACRRCRQPLRPVLARALAKSPDDRYATADEMAPRPRGGLGGAGAGRRARARAGRREGPDSRRRDAPGAAGGMRPERAPDPAHGGRAGGGRGARRPPRERRRGLHRPRSRAAAARRARAGAHARPHAVAPRAVAGGHGRRAADDPPARAARDARPTPLPAAGPVLPRADAPLVAPAPAPAAPWTPPASTTRTRWT